jgi:NADH-quinone oxidoreductase subunit N
LIAGVFSILLFSLAAIPLTAGFIGKFFIVLSGLGSALWTPVMVLIITSVIGLYYYLRAVSVMIDGSDLEPDETELPPLSAPRAVVLCIISFLILVSGVYPGPVIGIIRQAMQVPFIYRTFSLRR